MRWKTGGLWLTHNRMGKILGVVWHSERGGGGWNPQPTGNSHPGQIPTTVISGGRADVRKGGGANVRSWYRVHTRLVRSAAAVCAFIRLLGAGEMSISSVVYTSAQQHGPSTHVRRPRTPAVMFSALTKLTKTVSTSQKRKRKYKIWFGLCRV